MVGWLTHAWRNICITLHSPAKPVAMNITITEVHPADIPQTVDFVMRARAEIFPLLDTVTVPPDLAGFEQVYLSGKDGKFLIARCDERIIAAVGYLPYDHRFPQLDYTGAGPSRSCACTSPRSFAVTALPVSYVRRFGRMPMRAQ
ncbi:hypothetical protein PSA5_11830 [Pseudomonas syringae pv. actinidiae]|nr:hypothetical protein PSA5_11830 [Pseudomonas syringae pv. actinidiae]